jgi:hypothetical protein
VCGWHLFYKLCKYDLQCEKCPLDWELRNLSHTSSSNAKAPQEEKRINLEETPPAASWKTEKTGEGFLGEDPSLFHIKESLFYPDIPGLR